MRLFVGLLSMCLLVAVTPAIAVGPKVHTSKAKDITDCKEAPGGVRSVAGIGLGALIGGKIIGGSNGILAASAAGNVAGKMLDQDARCGPRAKIESEEAGGTAPKKKKIDLKHALGL